MKLSNKHVYSRTFGAGLLVFSAVALTGCGQDYSRAQFREMVINKTEAQVKAALGEPNLVRSDTWFYFRKTYDAQSHKDDYKASITFKHDQGTGQDTVSGVNFFATSSS